MDAKVNDFFNEINELTPAKDESVWKECHDELTGYTYYWNTKTDKVTWEPPPEFLKQQKRNKNDPPLTKKKNLYVPPPNPVLPPVVMKIYSIGECSQKPFSIGNSDTAVNKNVENNSTVASTPAVNSSAAGNRRPVKKPSQKTITKRDSESEDEKIELINSYGGDTDSETEEPDTKKRKHAISESDHNEEDDDDDMDILSKIKKAQAMKEECGDNISKKNEDATIKSKPQRDIAALELVAGYSDSGEESDSTDNREPVTTKSAESHSTLFPITQPIDIKDFIPKTEEPEKEVVQTDFDTKVFARKKRIGVALINTGKRKDDVLDEEGERKGLGFGSGETSDQSKSKVYPGFSKGGLLFVKSDVLHPSVPPGANVAATEDKSEKKEETANRAEVENMYETLREKLWFLNGDEKVSPIHTMLIQSEILFTAMKEGGLKLSYLQQWLQNTCSELIKLEKETTPEGWLLLWDRQNKRYYYQNAVTGHSQWEFPTLQKVAKEEEDDAMDISTTPPPPSEDEDEDSGHSEGVKGIVLGASPPPPPPPPEVRCDTPPPPPPPIISAQGEHGNVAEEFIAPPPPSISQNVPSPPARLKPELMATIVSNQPLPPGVDQQPATDVEHIPVPAAQPASLQTAPPPSDPLHSALNSFYSDIAALSGSTDQPAEAAASEVPSSTSEELPTAPEGVKKKKKAKVKLAAGLTLKKKGVSQMVEKWKNVQQSLK